MESGSPENPTESREKIQKHVPQVVAIDFDRTLYDVDAGMERLYAVAKEKEFDLDIDHIKQARKETEDAGKTFSPIDHIYELLDTEEKIQQFKERFIAIEGHPLLYPDVKPFFQMLDDNQMPYYMVTHAVNHEWQKLKIEASGYKGPVIILDHAEKGGEIANLKTPKGTYEVNGTTRGDVVADSVCLLDDKAVTFKGLPDSCIGYLLDRGGPNLKSQQGNRPWNVVKIHSLDEVGVANARLFYQKEQMDLAV